MDLTRLLSVLVLLVAVNAEARPTAPKPSGAVGPRIESFELVPVDSLNALIANESLAGVKWTKDPLLVALEVTGTSALGGRTLDLQYVGNNAEFADTAEVTLIADGYADDSVRGGWTQVRLARQGEGVWRVIELKRAWRCQRGHHLNSYSNQLCP